MNLVIVESPTKARTIGKFLGPDYTIKASMGHVIDLPKSKIGIDFEHDFAPQFEVISDKKKVISELKSFAKNASSIILATDPDREGEAIALHVADMLGSNEKLKIKNEKFRRIVFHEITQEAIDEALKNSRDIDKSLVDAQTARRVLDRLVGYKLSPLLWKKVRRGLSAGRVQSVALRLIVEREREIEKFGKEKYFTISAFLARGPAASFPATPLKEANSSVRSTSAPAKDTQVRAVGSPSSGVTPSSTEFELVEINGEKIEVAKTFDLYDGQYKITKTSIDSAKKAQEVTTDLKTKTFTVSDVLQKETKRSPAPPYTTSTLQQDAARRLFINGKRTMSLAQKLYEEGYITYHRTDSVAIGSAAVFSIINFVKKEFGEKYVPAKPRFYSAKQKLAQEAHEAIRPTAFGEISNFKFQISNLVGSHGWKLYELIWRRTVASQMSDAVVESTTVMADANNNVIPNEVKDLVSGGDSSAVPQNDNRGYRLKANGSVLVFDGFLKVNPLGLVDNRLPQFTVNEKLNLIDVLEKEHETLPPPRYNDASIIKTLEEKGIGRPSTYATIISTIESRQYIERGSPTAPNDRLRARPFSNGSASSPHRAQGKGSGRGFTPTAIGVAVNDFLVKNFSEIDDIPFTADMEDSLDAIAHGKKQWVPMMKDFYTPFEKKLGEVEGVERVHIAVEQTNEKCPTCGSPLVVRIGRFGKFLSCSTFPACKFTKTYTEETGLPCPKCGGPATPKLLAKGGKIVIKKTRRGHRFYGCSNYPKCDFAAWKIEDIKSH